MVNIGMGQAGESLARLFDKFIQLSVPRIQLVDPPSVVNAMISLFGEGTPVTAVRQAFSSRIRGEALVFYTDATCAGLGDLVGYPGSSTDELLLDVTNVLVGACISGLAAQFALALAFSPPSLLGRSECTTRILDGAVMPWSRALLAEVNFRVEGKTFECHLLTFWPDDSMDVLAKGVDDLLATLA